MGDEDTPEWIAVQNVLWNMINAAFPADARFKNRFKNIDGNKHIQDVDSTLDPKRTVPQIVRFQGSATEQEIWSGALSVPHADQHVLAFFREIENRVAFSDPKQIENFVDVDPSGTLQIEQLKAELRLRLGSSNLFPNKVPVRLVKAQDNQGSLTFDITTDHLAPLCADVVTRMTEIIQGQIDEYWRKTEPASMDRAVRDLEIEQNEYERFAKERGGEESFVGRSDLLESIRSYIKNDSPYPLVIYGDSGCGKTALLARAYQEIPSKEKPIIRFIGTTPRSSDVRSLLKSLCQELRERHPITETLSSDVRELMQEFRQHLDMATSEKPVILFLDALDQLSEADNGRQLSWIPFGQLPSHVKIVVSCFFNEDENDPVSQPYAELKRRQIPTENFINLDVLSEAEAHLLLFDRWLPKAGRKVSDDQRTRIEQRLASPACRQPIFLKLLFEEVQLWHSYDPAPVPGESVSTLLGQLFDRLSLPTNHGPLLVNRVLGYLSASRHGLAENEILEILFADPEYKEKLKEDNKRNRHELPPNATRIPIALWSRLRFDLAPYLTERAAPGANVLTFYHRQLAEWACCSSSEVLTQDWRPHQRLAEYYEKQVFFDNYVEEQRLCSDDVVAIPHLANVRKVTELPWQRLKEAQLTSQWNEVGALFTDLMFFEAKSGAGLIFELTDELRTAADTMPQHHPQKHLIKILDKALRRDIHFIARHRNDYPQALFQCLWNSCGCPYTEKTRAKDLKHTSIEVEEHLSSALHALLDSWRLLKTATTIWCEALQSPVIPPTHLPDLILEGHTGIIMKPVFSPDCLRIATSAPLEGKIRIWDVSSGVCLRTLVTGGTNGPAVWSPDNRHIAVTTSQDKMIIWDWYLDRIENVVDLPSSECDAVGIGIAVSPDGKYVAVSHRYGLVVICDFHSGSVLSQVHFSESSVFLMEFSSDGSSLAVASYASYASYDSMVRYLEVPSLAEQRSIRINNLSSCAMLPEGNVLAVCEKVVGEVGSQVILYDGRTGVIRAVVNDGTSAQYAEPQFVACSANGQHAAFIHNRGVTVIDLDRGTRVTAPIRFGATGFPSLSADGRLLAQTDLDQVMIWRLDSLEPSMIPRLEWEVREVAPSSCGQFVAVATESDFKGSLNESPFVILETASGTLISEWQHPGSRPIAFDCIAWFHHSAKVAFASHGGGPVWLWGPDWTNNLCRFDLRAACLKILVSPNDAWIGCTCKDGMIQLIQVCRAGMAGVRTLFTSERGDLEGGADTPLAFSSDSMLLAASIDHAVYVNDWLVEADENPIYIYQIFSPDAIVILKGHAAAATCLAFNSDGSLLASAARNKEVKIWDVATGREIHTLANHAGSVDAVAFTDNGRQVVSVDSRQRTYLWNVDNGELVQQWAGAFDAVEFAVYRSQPLGDKPSLLGYHLGCEFQVVNPENLAVNAALPTHFNDALLFLPQTQRFIRWNAGLLELYRVGETKNHTKPSESPSIFRPEVPIDKFQQRCRLCGPHNGNCRICGGKKYIEARHDVSHLRFELLRKKCPACDGTGKCYICHARKAVSGKAPLVANPTALRGHLRHLLTDQHWQKHLQTQNESIRDLLNIIGTAKNRHEAAELLSRLDLLQLWLLGLIGGARRTAGWDLYDLLGRLRRLQVPFLTVQEAMFSLEELGVLQREIRWRNREPYEVMIVKPESHIRFLCNFLADIRIDLSEPPKPSRPVALDDGEKTDEQDSIW